MTAQGSAQPRLFTNPLAFWFGCLLIAGGVFAHLPMYLMGAGNGYRMVGMPMDSTMLAGMALIPIGLALAAFGLMPDTVLRAKGPAQALDFKVADNAGLNAQHWLLMVALIVAVTVDVMKPATLGFIMPGMKAEYALEPRAAGVLPLFALMGTIIGSILWGRMADLIGRRGAILLSALMFMGTSICGAMPSFTWNVIMCFLMGLSAGGMLPITFTLLAEVIPARHRGWMLVALGGIGTAAGYLVASGSALLFEPSYSWRSLWLLGLPTGLIVIIFHQLIPESPRYLAASGRADQARAVMQRFGAARVDPAKEPVPAAVPAGQRPGFRTLLSGPYAAITIGLFGIGAAYGLVNIGFLLWLPTSLRLLGLEPAQVSFMLTMSGLLALPGVFMVIPLYQMWSSIRTVALFTILTALSLVIYAATGLLAPTWVPGIIVSIALVLISTSAVVATLIPYASEIYPLELRATGTGLIAASSKAGGFVGALMGFFGVYNHMALVGGLLALPLAGFGVLLWVRGIDTRGRRLEEIQGDVMARAAN